jgi:hypothetical protein
LKRFKTTHTAGRSAPHSGPPTPGSGQEARPLEEGKSRSPAAQSPVIMESTIIDEKVENTISSLSEDNNSLDQDFLESTTVIKKAKK